MATDAGELIVKISADVSEIKSALKQAGDTVQNFGAMTVAKGTLMADAFKAVGRSVVDFAKESVMAFAEHEASLTRLTILVGGDAARSMYEYAESLKMTTAYSDDQVLSLERQLSQYGIYPGSVKEATKALLDFAAVTGNDLPEAGSMLARAMSGQSRELKQYGLELSTVSTRSENLDKTIAFLQSRFGGASETIKGTTLGALQNLTNRVEDLKKKFGEQLMPVLQSWTRWAEGAVGLMEKLTNRTGANLTANELALKQLRERLRLSHDDSEILLLNRLIAETQKRIDADKKLTDAAAKNSNLRKGAVAKEIPVLKSLEDEIMRLKQEQDNLAVFTAKTTEKKILAGKIELAQMKSDQTQMTEFTQQETSKRLMAAQASWEANASFSDQLKLKLQTDALQTTATWVNMATQMMDSFAQSTAAMIVEGGRFSDVIRNLWKQIAEQVIAQIIRMMVQWAVFNAMTGGAGGAFSSFFGGGRMAEGGMINEPSMLIGMRSGSRHLVGEAGPEAVVPMASGTGSANRSGGAPKSSSGDIHINISGQFLEGSQSKWQEMVNTAIVPAIKRWTMSNPTGPFKRVRGTTT